MRVNRMIQILIAHILDVQISKFIFKTRKINPQIERIALKEQVQQQTPDHQMSLQNHPLKKSQIHKNDLLRQVERRIPDRIRVKKEQ